MKYINGIGYIDENKYYSTSSQHTTDGSAFDSVFEAETIIYATPETNSLQSNNSGGSSSQSVTSPEKLDAIFKHAANTYGVDENLLKAVAKAESNFNASAVSSAGAIGVMQLMPSTAASLGVSNPYNAEDNIMGGAKYLSKLLTKYNGNTSLALAAYNAGSGNVDKYGGIPPFKETQNYVSKILGYIGTSTTTEDTIYAVAAGQSNGNPAQAYSTENNNNNNSVTTIYAVAANDAASSARIYLQ